MSGLWPRRARPAVALALLSLAGCASKGEPAAAATATDASVSPYDVSDWDDVVIAETAADDELEVRVPIAAIAPGTEDQRTIERLLGNDKPVFVDRVTWTSPKGLHHSRLDAPPELSFHTYPVLGLPVGVSEAVESFPAGTALAFAAKQPLKISYHYVNAGKTPIEGEVVVRFRTLPEGAPPPTPLTMLWVMNEAIDLPPHAKTDVVTSCTVPSAMTLHDLVPHTHGLGVGVEVFLVGGPDDGRRIYASTAWSDGPQQRYAPPLSLAAGAGVRVVCHYENTTDARVQYGDLAADEMCIVAGHVTGPSSPTALVVPTGGTACVVREERGGG